MPYKQLTHEQRYTIFLAEKEGTSIANIAQKIGVHRSSIYREFKRYSCPSVETIYQHIQSDKETGRYQPTP